MRDTKELRLLKKKVVKDCAKQGFKIKQADDDKGISYMCDEESKTK
jgi:hypothetical protein